MNYKIPLNRQMVHNDDDEKERIKKQKQQHN